MGWILLNLGGGGFETWLKVVTLLIRWDVELVVIRRDLFGEVSWLGFLWHVRCGGDNLCLLKLTGEIGGEKIVLMEVMGCRVE